MAAYHWAMRHASVILFTVSLVIFLIGFGQALLALRNTAAGMSISGEPVSGGAYTFLMLLTGTFAALGSATLPFLGAVVIHRWDRRG